MTHTDMQPEVTATVARVLEELAPHVSFRYWVTLGVTPDGYLDMRMVLLWGEAKTLDQGIAWPFDEARVRVSVKIAMERLSIPAAT